MTPELLSSFCAVLVSLAASYIPGFSDWYGGLEGIHKRLLMLGLLAALALGVYALACLGLGSQISVSLTCDTPGALALGKAFLAAVVSNQAAFAISPKLRRIQAAA